MTDRALKQVGSTFRWLEAYPQAADHQGLQDAAFAAIVLTLAGGAALLVTVGHEAHTVAMEVLKAALA